MHSYIPDIYPDIYREELLVLINTEHWTRNTEPSLNFQTLQTLQTFLSPQRGTRNIEHGTFPSNFFIIWYRFRGGSVRVQWGTSLRTPSQPPRNPLSSMTGNRQDLPDRKSEKLKKRRKTKPTPSLFSKEAWSVTRLDPPEWWDERKLAQPGMMVGVRGLNFRQEWKWEIRTFRTWRWLDRRQTGNHINWQPVMVSPTCKPDFL